MAPEGGKVTGWVDNQLALDGFAVIQDYQQRRGDAVIFRGHGVFGWDAAAQEHTLHWFDSMGLAPSVFRGRFDGEILTLTAQQDQGYTRATWDFTPTRSYHYRMEVSSDGDQWRPFITAEYRVASDE
jgi:hypothetical protein